MIYLDHAASTPMRPEAIAAMMPFLTEHPGNPSGSHRASQTAKNALEQAREDCASVIGCDAREVLFTGGGSESDNLAIKGAAFALRAANPARNRVVTTGIEHKAVLAAVHRLAIEGFSVTEVPATIDGIVDLDAFAASINEHTAVVSVMAVNNETGTMQPLSEIAAIVREHAPSAVLHTDAVQAPQWLDLRPIFAQVDVMSLSGHKFGGPKGVGVLAKRRSVDLVPLIEGGGHELGFRAGTQNVAGIVSFAAALMVTDAQRSDETVRIAAMRDALSDELTRHADATPNGDLTRRVAGLLHLAFEGIEAETMLFALDSEGVCAASGSACSSGAIDPSHVLLAMGMPRERALSSVRFSLGWATSEDDIARAIPIIQRVSAQLRSIAA